MVADPSLASASVPAHGVPQSRQAESEQTGRSRPCAPPHRRGPPSSDGALPVSSGRAHRPLPDEQTRPDRDGRPRRRGAAGALGTAPRTRMRPVAAGKFVHRGDEKLYVRGVTYGTFRPDAAGDEYPSPTTAWHDLALMAASGGQRGAHVHPAAALVPRRRRPPRLLVLPGSRGGTPHRPPQRRPARADARGGGAGRAGGALFGAPRAAGLQRRQRDPGLDGPVARAASGRTLPREPVLRGQGRRP